MGLCGVLGVGGPPDSPKFSFSPVVTLCGEIQKGGRQKGGGKNLHKKRRAMSQNVL